MPWLQFKLQVDAEQAERASEALIACGAVSVSLEDAGAQPLFELAPDQSPLWADTRLVGLYPADAHAQDIAACLRVALDAQALDYQAEVLPDQDWERAYLAYYKPLDFGDLWVCPSWCEPPEPDAINVILDPGLAFGTGTHASTALCLDWLAGRRWHDASVIDYGCGSGILAIAALKLGARDAIGVDIDPRALVVSEENARRNDVADRYRFFLPEALPAGQFADLVLANILADPLVALAPTLIALVKPGGHLVLAGLLAEEAARVRKAYPEFDFAVAGREGWAMLAGERRR